MCTNICDVSLFPDEMLINDHVGVDHLLRWPKEAEVGKIEPENRKRKNGRERKRLQWEESVGEVNQRATSSPVSNQSHR